MDQLRKRLAHSQAIRPSPDADTEKKPDSKPFVDEQWVPEKDSELSREDHLGRTNGTDPTPNDIWELDEDLDLGIDHWVPEDDLDVGSTDQWAQETDLDLGLGDAWAPEDLDLSSPDPWALDDDRRFEDSVQPIITGQNRNHGRLQPVVDTPTESGVLAVQDSVIDDDLAPTEFQIHGSIDDITSSPVAPRPAIIRMNQKLQIEKRHLQTDNQQLKHENQQLQTEILKRQSEKDHLQTELLKRQSEKSHIQTELLKCQSENDQLQTEIQQGQSEKSQLQTELQQLQSETQRLQTENKQLSMAIYRLKQQQNETDQKVQARLTTVSTELTQQKLSCDSDKQTQAHALQQCQSIIHLQRSHGAAAQNASLQQIDKLQAELLTLQTDLLVSRRNVDTCQKQKAVMSNHFQQEIGKHERMLTEKMIALTDVSQECANTIAGHLKRQNETQHLTAQTIISQNQTIVELEEQLQQQTNVSGQIIQKMRIDNNVVVLQLNSTAALQQHTLGQLAAANLTIVQLMKNQTNMFRQLEIYQTDLNMTLLTTSQLRLDFDSCVKSSKDLAAKLADEESKVTNLTQVNQVFTDHVKNIDVQKHECNLALQNAGHKLNMTQLQMTDVLARMESCAETAEATLQPVMKNQNISR